MFERVLAAQRRLYGSVSSTVADTLASLAQVRLAQKNFGAAEKLIVEALDAHRDSESTAYLKIGYLQTMLATVQMRTAKFGDAEDLLRETLDLFAKTYAARSPVRRLRRALPRRSAARAEEVPARRRRC